MVCRLFFVIFANTLIAIYESQIDATIVMRCRIEKQNYANRTGFTLNLTITGGNLLFLLDSLRAIKSAMHRESLAGISHQLRLPFIREVKQ
jgi:hypothetical protein